MEKHCHICGELAHFQLTAKQTSRSDWMLQQLTTFYTCRDHLEKVWQLLEREFAAFHPRIFIDKADRFPI